MIKKISAIIVFLAVVVAAFISSLTSQPSFNGATPGCAGGGCHTFQSGILAAGLPGGLAVQITLSGGSGNVAGELVDTTGAVVSVNNGTSSNPFTLTAPHAGRYTVNAGYKNPSRRWDSTQVEIILTGVGDDQTGLPGYYQLGQNYPNPFNPTTSIDYSIPVRSQVTLKVYDISGREVATLVDGFEEPGTKTVTFDADGIASGVYVYRLQAGNYTETKHLIVMR
jgi:hypothetical protein